MNDIGKGMLIALMVLTIISPIDLVPGSLYDLRVLLHKGDVAMSGKIVKNN
ncbi:MAG: hypothetical protein J6I46_10765 [Ruminococcus sp.]|nr:hypothetical protein [Ruminococcus sp.]